MIEWTWPLLLSSIRNCTLWYDVAQAAQDQTTYLTTAVPR